MATTGISRGSLADLLKDSMQRNYEGPASSSVVSDPLFDWLFSVAKQATPTGNTGNPPIDQLFDTLKPAAQVVANEAIAMAIRKLRTGDRKTLAILGTGFLVGGWPLDNGIGLAIEPLSSGRSFRPQAVLHPSA